MPDQPIASGRSLADLFCTWSIWSLMWAGVIREFRGVTEIVSFGFYTLHVVDPPVILIFLAIAMQMVRKPFAKAAYTIPIVIIALLILINFGRGMVEGSAPALLWVRGTAAIAAILLLALCIDVTPNALRSIRNSLRVGAILLCVLLALRLALGPNIFMTANLEGLQNPNEGRPLSVVGAFLMLVTLIMALSDTLRRDRLRLDINLLMSLILPIMILLTGQGTVTIAMIVAIGIVIVFERGPYRGARAFLGIAGLVAASGFFAAMGSDRLLSKDNAELVAHRSDNLGTRQEIWSGLMNAWPNEPLANQILGLPGGQLPTLVVHLNKGTAIWNGSIHSMFYGSLPIMGYVGLGAYVLLLVILLSMTGVPLIFGDRRGGQMPASAFACCVMTVILSISYEIRNEEVLALFLAIWWVRQARSLRMEERAGQSAQEDEAQTVVPSRTR